MNRAEQALSYMEEQATRGISAAEEMGAFYDRRGKRNKHRIDIYNASGARVARHYDYGGAAYLLKWYSGIYTPEKYIIKIF